MNELAPDGRDVQFGGEQNCSLSAFSATKLHVPAMSSSSLAGLPVQTPCTRGKTHKLTLSARLGKTTYFTAVGSVTMHQPFRLASHLIRFRQQPVWFWMYVVAALADGQSWVGTRAVDGRDRSRLPTLMNDLDTIANRLCSFWMTTTW